jgi:hypothetical protein
VLESACGNIADADPVADGCRYHCGPVPHTDDLTVPVTDNAALDRAAQYAVGHGRLGTGRGDAPLPFI